MMVERHVQYFTVELYNCTSVKMSNICPTRIDQENFDTVAIVEGTIELTTPSCTDSCKKYLQSPDNL